jgi:hypothetical protein
MRSYGFFLILVLGLGVGTVMVVPATSASDPAKINQLVARLGSENFRQRESATKELDALGEQALEALRTAAKSSDMEVASRAAALVARIEHRAENARLLAPTYVELSFKDTPVEEAVAELAKKSGYQVIIAGDRTKLAGRKVTLETGKVTFWKALEALCERAELVEADGTVNVPPVNQPVPFPQPVPPIQFQPLPAPIAPPQIQIKPINVQPLPPVQRPKPAPLPPEGFGVEVQVQPAQPVPAKPVAVQPAPQPVVPAVQPLPVRRGPVIRPQPGYNGTVIVLMDGKPGATPAHVEGAVRVRAVTNANLLANYGPAPAGEIALLLEFRSEPKLQVQQVLGVKIDKAVDDRDQELSQVVLSDPTPGVGGPVFIGQQKMMMQQVQIAQPAIARPYTPGGYGYVNGNGANYLPARLKRGDHEAKSLKELRGTVSLKVRTAVEDLATVENILKAKGEAVRGKGEAIVKVVGVSKEENGDVKLEVEMTIPNEVQPQARVQQFNGVPGSGPPPPQPAPLPPVNGNFKLQLQAAPAAPAVQPVPPAPPVGGFPAAPPQVAVHNFLGLDLVDAKGKEFHLVQLLSTKNVWQGNGRTMTATLTFRPEKDQGEAAKLVFKGTRFASVEVPFVLRDVPLN